MTRLKTRYLESIKPALQTRFGYANPMMVPELKKVVISMGLAEATKDKNALQDCINELAAIAGQKPVICRAKKAISNFKLRKDQAIGLMVTLRGKKMYEFLDRFCNIAAPRIRDFRGLNPKGDGRGNYSFGLEDQGIFAEIDLDKVKRAQGMNISLVTSAATNDECIELLRLLGIPFKGLPVVVEGWLKT